MLLASVLIAFVSTADAQTSSSLPRVFIEPMERDFNTFLTAAIMKLKTPVLIVSTSEGADYVISGTSAKGDNKWSDTIFGNEKDRNQGSISVVRTSDKTIAWAGSAGDKSTFFSGLRGTGQKKVAERIAKKLKKELFNGKMVSVSIFTTDISWSV